MISIGYVVGTVIALLALVAIVVVAAWLGAGLNSGERRPIHIGAVLAVVLTIGLWVWGTWPSLNMDYHTFRSVSGTVVANEARMLADGNGGTTQNFAVRLDDGQTYRCDDTRCSLVKPGDHLELSCMKEWQYAATPGDVCRFVNTRPKTVTP